MKTASKVQKQRIVRQLIKNATIPEKKLRTALAQSGIKFAFQKPFDIRIKREKGPKSDWKPKFYVVDFYLPDKRAAIEIDGDIHTKQQQYDVKRTQQLLTASNRMLKFIFRFHNHDILYDLPNVVQAILSIRICRGPNSKKYRKENMQHNKKLHANNQIRAMVHMDPDLSIYDRIKLLKNLKYV